MPSAFQIDARVIAPDAAVAQALGTVTDSEGNDLLVAVVDCHLGSFTVVSERLSVLVAHYVIGDSVPLERLRSRLLSTTSNDVSRIVRKYTATKSRGSRLVSKVHELDASFFDAPGRGSIVFCEKLGPLLSRVQRARGKVHTLTFFELSTEGQGEVKQSLAFGPRHRVRESYWFDAQHPVDIVDWLSLGLIWDPIIPLSRFPCEQCTYAWWRYVKLQQGFTQSQLCSDIATLCERALFRSGDSADVCRHGLWTSLYEVHTRFFLDGLQMCSEIVKTKNSHRAQLYISRRLKYLVARLVARCQHGTGVWIMHDSNESVSQRFAHYGAFWQSSPMHSFTLNTHIHGLSTLVRISRSSDQSESADAIFHGGLAALKGILGSAPAEAAYQTVEKRIAERYSRDGRGFGAWTSSVRLFREDYQVLKRDAPRLVMPSGFIERDLNLSVRSLKYHVANLIDLMNLYRLVRDPVVESTIIRGVGWLVNNLEVACQSEYGTAVPDILRFAQNMLPYEADKYAKLYDRSIEEVQARHGGVSIATLAASR